MFQIKYTNPMINKQKIIIQHIFNGYKNIKPINTLSKNMLKVLLK